MESTLKQQEANQQKLDEVFQAAKSGELKLTHSIKINDTKVDLGDRVHPSNILPRLIKLAKAGTAICIVGPSGVGKSFAVEQLQKVLEKQDAGYSRFGVISLTEGLSETSLFGRMNTVTGEWMTTDFIEIYENGGVFLFDEIDASDPNMLLSVNRAMAQNDLRNPYTGKMHKRHEKFLPVAAANTTMRGANALYVARNRIDAATINRFSAGWIMMTWDHDLEKFLCPDMFLVNRLWDVRKYLEENGSSEIVSTRTIEYAYRNKEMGGMNYAEIFDSISCAWSSDLRDDVYRDVLSSHGIKPVIDAVNISFDLGEDSEEN